MKKLLLMVFFCIFPFMVSAHEGDAIAQKQEIINKIKGIPCEVELSNNSDLPAQTTVTFDYGARYGYTIPAHHSLFINLFYSGYCHKYAFFSVYSYNGALIFNDYLKYGDVLHINPA